MNVDHIVLHLLPSSELSTMIYLTGFSKVISIMRVGIFWQWLDICLYHKANKVGTKDNFFSKYSISMNQLSLKRMLKKDGIFHLTALSFKDTCIWFLAIYSWSKSHQNLRFRLRLISNTSCLRLHHVRNKMCWWNIIPLFSLVVSQGSR